MARPDGRSRSELRPVRITRHFLKGAPASVLIEMGNTRVLCTAIAQEGVPPFMANSGRGWVTAEYGMLPASTSTRKQRDRSGKVDGRTAEIQRLIGRSLRTITDASKLGERTIWIDCDVLDADGGTRTASVTGAYVALVDCVEGLRAKGLVTGKVIREAVAAVSAGIVDGKPTLDLSYVEDSGAEADMNIVMTAGGRFVEVQGTGEKRPFTRVELDSILNLGRKGILKLVRLQREALSRR
jgi:ribonuclease PH